MRRFKDVFVLALVCCCVLLTVGQTSSDCSCQLVPGADGCEPNQACETTVKCFTENVAYGKPARISSIFSNPARGGPAGPACAAVNGKTSTVMYFLNESNTNCVHTDPNEQGSLWEVDLGRSYTVTSVTIYGRDQFPKRVAGIWIYVDNQLCFKIPGINDPALNNYTVVFTVQCILPVRGRMVKLSKEGQYDTSNSAINICEVQIWVCRYGKYGETCEYNCSGHCQNSEVCDNFNGSCYNGCERGYYGQRCDQQCGQCAGSDTCDAITGRCPVNCRVIGLQPPLCKDACTSGMYGPNCSLSCGHCLDLTGCNAATGLCLSCSGNYRLPDCKDCRDGFYGANCGQPCGQCSGSERCDQRTGHCPGSCLPGRQPPFCLQPCPAGLYGTNCIETCGHCANGQSCDVTNGHCHACEGNYFPPLCQDCRHGYYGAKCGPSCGQCAGSETCNQRTGHCPGSCLPARQPPLCQTCTTGLYGTNCTETCGHCAEGQPCDVTSGHCDACEGNFFPPFCQDCSSGHYGSNCSQNCSLNCAGDRSCNQTTGYCIHGCSNGWLSPACTTISQADAFSNPDHTDAIIGGVVSGVVVVAAAVVLVVIFVIRRKRQSESKTDNQASLSLADDNTGVERPLYMGSIATVGSHTGVERPLHMGAIATAGVRKARPMKPKAEVKPVQPTDGHQNDQGTGIHAAQHRQDLEEAHIYLNTAEVKAKANALPQYPQPSTDHSQDATVYANVGDNFSSSLQQQQQQHHHHHHHHQQQQQTKALKFQPEHKSSPPKPNVRLKEHSATASAPLTLATPVPLARTVRGVDDDVEGDIDHDDDVIGKDDNEVYATFKAQKPKLDSVQTYLVDRLASGRLCEEFSTIPKVIETEASDAGNLHVNFKKNRFASILPYDRTRVVLKDGYTESNSTDYVNASYITDWDSNTQYIAAQGPREKTLADFWRLVWQEKVTRIVMLTNLAELGKPKCTQYWPEGEGATTTFGPVIVKTQTVDERDTFVVRQFTIKRLGGRVSRTVTHFHFKSWLDHGVPSVTSLVIFWRFVANRSRDATEPLLVHCSAGVGRTGTFIGLDFGMKTVQKCSTLNVLDLVQKMRKERTLMVQSKDQYIFLHKALLEAYTARTTLLSLDGAGAAVLQVTASPAFSQRVTHEYEALQQMKSLSPEQCHKFAEQAENVNKNRVPDLLPLDAHVVFLTEPIEGRNQYINAVFKSNGRDPQGSILTQLPLPSTLLDFWRLVQGHTVATVVSLESATEELEIRPYCHYWRREVGARLDCGPYSITTVSQHPLGPSLTRYALQLLRGDEERPPRHVTLFHLRGWQGEVGIDPSLLLRLIDLVHTSSAAVPGSKIVIQCSDGVRKSGLFAVLCDLITRMTCDREVDVYMTVRHMHSVIPSAVTSLAQFRMCYTVAQQYCKETNIYANT